MVKLWIPCRETQLRSFYSTTEEISVLFAKQQEQLKAMQRTLEDEENYDNTSIDIDLNFPMRDINGARGREEDATENAPNTTAKSGSTTSARRFDKIRVETSSDEASVTEKHDCDIESQEAVENTQEMESTSAADHGVKVGFGSDIEGIGTAPIVDGEGFGTMQVPETESPGINGDQVIDLNKNGTFNEDTMQLDEEADEQGQMSCRETLRNSESNRPSENENQKDIEDTDPGGTIRTSDLLASEVVGSWACSTAPSVHGDNDSLIRDDNDNDNNDNGEGGAALHDSNLQVAESQSNPSSEPVVVQRNHERQALCEMIGIVAPDLKEQFGGGMSEDDEQQGGKQSSHSDSDTESCSDNDEEKGIGKKGGSISDEETQDSGRAEEKRKLDNEMDEDEEATQQDSVG